MVTLLKMEQRDNDKKKAYCIESFGETEDAAKDLAHRQGATEEHDDQLLHTHARTSMLQKSVSKLDDSVTRATQSRQEPRSEIVTSTANNDAGTELLKLAINRLHQFCVTKLLKAASKTKLSFEAVCMPAWAAASPPPDRRKLGGRTL